MNVDSSMRASSGQAAHWEQIDWAKCERQVGRLQARIVKATREGRWTMTSGGHSGGGPSADPPRNHATGSNSTASRP
jgi:hypothetical protein